MALETEFETAGGVVRLIDFMPIRAGNPVIIRIVEGIAGTVDLAIDLVVRFDTGKVTPWVRRCDDALVMTAGPDALCVRGSIEVHGEDLATVWRVEVRAGAVRCATSPIPRSWPGCFWLVDLYVQLGRTDEAGRLFEKLLGLRNDLGLLSEEYDPGTGRALGNFPQAFSHLSLITSAYNLTTVAERPARHRSGRHGQ